MQIRLKQPSSLHRPLVQLRIFSPPFGLGLVVLVVVLVVLVLLLRLLLLMLVLVGLSLLVLLLAPPSHLRILVRRGALACCWAPSAS